MPSGKRVASVYKGKKYPSDAAIAKVAGVTPPAVRHMRLRGRLDELGEKQPPRVGKIRIRDDVFATVSEAAAYHSVTENAIYQARLRGSLDSVGDPSTDEAKRKKRKSK